ncbi:ATP-binding cassette domain-containing protein [Ruania rhizosphaerae]|uniref:ATP-binding cassette domain-containing protein n=1 Tax=Ruania rhizosphaerae TaxID=1840413 RepID=UPI001359D530|nr:ATP-binding cassette domain-containing protein [Ruania rhizosphaerae]
MIPSPATAVVLRIAGADHAIGAGTLLRVGRGSEVDLHLTHPRVSRQHLTIEGTDRGCVITDSGSRYGTFVDGTPLHGALEVTSSVHLTLGTGGPEVDLIVSGQQTGRRSARLDAVGAALILGRDPGCDLTLEDPLVSRRHVRLTREQQGIRAEDVGSTNGIHHRGVRTSTVLLSPGEDLTVGRHTLRVHQDSIEVESDPGVPDFVVESVSYTLPNGKNLLQDISFALPGGSVLAVVGPSGAGKSTLLGALTGSQPATSGRVRYGGRDLYLHLDHLRHRIGVVPQDDVVHSQLTVRQALTFAAELRFPEDMAAAERTTRVDAVLAELGLTDHAGTQVSRLSGGQRKRTSVALELLTEPSLLFLDEPTSGLDPGRDKQLMETVRDLADGGRTVCIITHSTDNLDLCDRVLFLAPGGRTAYFGEPAALLDHFGVTKYADAFQLTESRPEEMAERFRAARHASDRVFPPAHPQVTSTPAPTDADHAAAPVPTRSIGRQLGTLMRRHLRVLLADRIYLAFLLLMPALVALLALVVPGDQGLAAAAPDAPPSTQPAQILVIVVLGAVFIGLSMGIRELVSERAVFVRERSVGLSATAYLLAKICVLSTLAILQSIILVVVLLAVREGPESAVLLGSAGLELTIAVAGCSIASMGVGLCLSALVRNAAQFMPIVVVLVMAQLVLSGGLFPVAGRAALEVAALIAPARWGFAAAASTVDLNAITPREPDGLWDHDPGTWLLSVLMMDVLAAVFCVLCWLRLKAPYRMR